MLKKVHISNFLSCQDTEIELDQVTALIGRNAAGKTNVLKAIEWCAQFAVGNVSLDEHFNFGLEPNFEIEFLIGDDVFKYELKIAGDYRDHMISIIESLSCFINSDWQVIIKREDDSAAHYDNEVTNIEINNETPMISSLLSLMPKNKINPAINKVYQYLTTIKYYVLDDEYENAEHSGYLGPIDDNSYKQWLTKKNKIKSSVDMKLLYLWHEDKATLYELIELIGGNCLNIVKDIQIDPFEYGTKDEKFYIVRFHVPHAVVPYTHLSYGTQRVLTLLLALLYDKNSTLLIEQPEDGIHSGLLKKLLPLCFEYATVYNKQIIIATHSPDVINLLPPESIRLVKMTEKGTKVAALNKDQIPMIRDYMKHEGALFDFIKSMNDE